MSKINSKGEIKFLCNVTRDEREDGIHAEMACEIALDDVSTREITEFLKSIADELAKRAPDAEARVQVAMALLKSGMEIAKGEFATNPRTVSAAIQHPELVASLKAAARVILTLPSDDVEVQPSTQEMIERAMRGGGARA